MLATASQSLGAVQWRARVLRGVAWFVLVGGVVVWCVWALYRGRLLEVPTLSMAAVLLVLGAAIARGKSDDVLAIALVSAMTTASTFSLSIGLMAGPLLCATGAVVVATALLGRRGALAVLATVVATLVLGGYAVAHGYLPMPETEHSDLTQWGTWLRDALVFSVAAGAVALIVDGVVRALEGSLARVQHALDALETEQTRRQVADEQRLLAERALDRAARLEAIGRLAGGTAHDFNNHLTVIQGWVDLMRREALTPRAREGLNAIETARKQAAQLTAELLALGRSKASQPTRIPLEPELSELAQSWQRVLPAHIELVVETAAKSSILANQSEFQQVLLNLVLNARDAMPEGGTVTVSTRDLDGHDAKTSLVAGDGSYVAVTVKDTGTGLDAAVRDHIFEPFFTTKGAHGNGLGLAMVWFVMQRLGGAVTVESAPGEGASFTLLFPAA